MLDYIRIACAVPAVKVGDTRKNAEDICAYMEKADGQNADIVMFPELALTGCSCGDLFWQDALLSGAEAGLKTILACSEKHPALTCVVGLPVRSQSGVLNCAAVIAGGEIHGLSCKHCLSAGENRWFAGGMDSVPVRLLGEDYYACTGLLYEMGGAKFAIEIGSEGNAPIPPSSVDALKGAEVILNPAAWADIAGEKECRANRVRSQSDRCKCVYVSAGTGSSESTTDLVYSGHSLICENGSILGENEGVAASDYLLIRDCDLGLIRGSRRKDTAWRCCADRLAKDETVVIPFLIGDAPLRSDGSLYPLRKLPFIPSEKHQRERLCRDMFQLQVEGLKQRLRSIGNVNAVIGISGGLDSTLALLVAVEAMHQLGRPADHVFGVTMPCFGTSDRTYQNSWELMRTLGINAKEISIRNAVTAHFADIGHDISVHNGTFENSQARERTQILMDYASVVGGIVVGTGDLSELALGWCTYNGDQMSMYGVNSTVPKTLIRWIIETVSQEPNFAASRAVLEDILDTPISPELLPPDAQGKIAQYTEDLVGPYALHDFFLYYMVGYGFSPKKIYAMACRAFAADFDGETIKKWLKSFCRRFFTQQFKRSAMPDGVQVGPISLSPRGGLVMPSDAAARLWLEEADTL